MTLPHQQDQRAKQHSRNQKARTDDTQHLEAQLKKLDVQISQHEMVRCMIKRCSQTTGSDGFDDTYVTRL